MSDDQGVAESRLRRSRAKRTPPASGADAETAAPPSETAAPPAETTSPDYSHQRRPRRWLHTAVIVAIALVVGVIAAGLSGYAVAKSTPTYQSQALLEIDQPQAIASSTDEGVVAKLGRLRFKYAGLVRTQVFSQPVADQLGLNRGLVGSSLYAIADQQSLLLAVGARTHNPDQARLIAQAASQYLTTYVRDEQNRNSIPEAQQVTFTIASPAVAAVKTAPTRRREVLVSVFVFIFAAGIVAGLAFAGRRRDS